LGPLTKTCEENRTALLFAFLLSLPATPFALLICLNDATANVTIVVGVIVIVSPSYVTIVIVSPSYVTIIILPFILPFPF
jgi:hypothetical protein